MSKCYRRQQTARGTPRPNVHPKTHQRLRCPSEETLRRRPSRGVPKPARRLSNYTSCRICLWSFCERSPRAPDGFSWLQEGNCPSHMGWEYESGIQWIANQSLASMQGANSINRTDSRAFGRCPKADMLVCYWVKHIRRRAPPPILAEST